MLAKRLPSILPTLTAEESIETTRIYSSLGRLKPGQPLEDRTVTISRALRSTTFPANFMLVAALNPCPCGFRTDPRRSCSCSPRQIERYMARISGPLLDRIDIHIEVPAVPFQELS